MKAIIEVDVPDHQIGQEVSIYLKDTMMIKGIVQESSGDLISRQAVLDLMRRETRWCVRSEDGKFNNVGLLYDDVMFGIDKLPPVKQEPKWIPVSEKLPKNGTWNLFTDGKNVSVERYKSDTIDHFYPNGRWFSLDEAIAWMPLPQPYKAESEEV